MPEPAPGLPGHLPIPPTASEAPPAAATPLVASATVPALPVIPVEEPCVPLAGVQSPWTGIVGALTLFLAQVALARGWIDERYFVTSEFLKWVWNARDLWALVVVFLVMAAMEGLVFRVYRRQFDFTTARALDGDAWRRIEVRWFGLFFLFMLAWIVYLVLDVYHADFFFDLRFWPKPPPDASPETLQAYASRREPEHAAFFSFLFLLTPVVLTAAPFYFWLVERRLRELRPERDELHLVGLWVSQAMGGPSRGIATAANPHFSNVFRSWLVKVFFLPLMFTWYLNKCGPWQESLSLAIAGFRQFSDGDASITLDHARRVYMVCYHGVFMLDLALCVIGYTFTLRLFDTHVRSAEPTLFGWLVALACYPPVNFGTIAWIAYGSEEEWLVPMRTTFATHPSVFIAWGGTIVLLIGIYVLATVMFGMRFSNLTNRGILSRGPYAIVRHPAYVSKNLAWWLMSVPFLRSFGDCARLLLWNVIYALRARTEEAHLGQDPHYREYMRKVRWKFIPGVW